MRVCSFLLPVVCLLVAFKCSNAFWLWDLFTGNSATKDEITTPSAASSSRGSSSTTSLSSKKDNEDSGAAVPANEDGSSGGSGGKKLIPPPRPGKLPATSSKFFSKAPPKTFTPERRAENASVVPVRHQFDG